MTTTATTTTTTTTTPPTTTTTTTPPTTTTTTTPPTTTPSTPSEPAYNATSLIQSNVPNLSTFQSNNSRVVYVPGAGIFVGYVASESGTYGTPTDLSHDRVAFSADNGATWTTLLDVAVSYGHAPPSLEADTAGNVYAFFGEVPAGVTSARMYKFPAGNYTHPVMYPIGTLSAKTDKWASAYDPATNHLYYLKGDGSTGSFRLYTINASTDRVLQDLFLLKSTSTTYPHYPLIYVANDGSGLTLLAWTNTLRSNNGYYDIHYLVSADQGQSWIGKDGTIPPSAYPIDPTNNGPSFAVMDPSEYTASTSRWLANIYVQDAKLFFVYSGEAGGTVHLWFRRVSWPIDASDGYSGPATSICGETMCLDNLAAFFSGRGNSQSRIFLTSELANKNDIATLYSDDDGASWHDYAVSSNPQWESPYAIAGSHRLGPSGEIFGAFTGELGQTYSGNLTEFFHTDWQAAATSQ